MKTALDRLPTVAEMDAARRGRPLPKGKTRLQETVEQRPLTKVDEKAFKAEVWSRDKSHCRWCERKVQKIVGRVPERGEVHHLHGRLGDLRWETRCAILVCLTCHEKLTGRVAEKWIAIGTKFWMLKGIPVIDAREPIKFQRAA